ncbi:uncharacterized protein LOC143579360 [Bidens hawaiensis]|uniref:uncharacterized protein LOC143579360 n=1 Tax=Bidens hawaiensis TaxID=980011 RepID=UPI004049F365
MADSSSESLSMSTLLHLVTLKLTPTNYLVWKNHMLPIFAFQNLLGHIDGTSLQPSSTITVEGKTTPNPAASLWAAQDQKAVILLNASLTEEVASEVLGISGARQIWIALELAFSNSSTERMYFLHDTLRQLTKGTSLVTDYSRKFKSICDQLAAIGQPVLELDKFHWFLCGLGPAFENFSVLYGLLNQPRYFVTLLLKPKVTRFLCNLLMGVPTHQRPSQLNISQIITAGTLLAVGQIITEGTLIVEGKVMVVVVLMKRGFLIVKFAKLMATLPLLVMIYISMLGNTLLLMTHWQRPFMLNVMLLITRQIGTLTRELLRT